MVLHEKKKKEEEGNFESRWELNPRPSRSGHRSNSHWGLYVSFLLGRPYGAQVIK